MASANTVFLNGEWLPAGQARVSVFDRGFIFGDGVYEVIPVYGKRAFRLPQHLDRLESSCDAIRLDNPHNDREWQRIIEQLIAQNDANDQMIYLQVTRGAAPRDHVFPAKSIPTSFAYSKAITYPDKGDLATGVKAITTPDIRWQRCDIKSIALLANVILRQNALEKGATEAILIRDNFLTEGAASNIFIVKDDCIVTPPKSELILPGITRDLVVELARSNQVCVEERLVTLDEMLSAREVWMTSSTKEILPIVKIDSTRIGDGTPGPMHARLFDIVQDYKDRFRKGEVD
jgi:D-alanine transaminase